MRQCHHHAPLSVLLLPAVHPVALPVAVHTQPNTTELCHKFSQPPPSLHTTLNAATCTTHSTHTVLALQ
jgi:hypothetical protein